MNDISLAALAPLLLVAVALLLRFLNWWRSAKGRASVFAADHDLDDVAMSAMSMYGAGKGRRRRDGMIELRVPFGLAIILPAVAAMFLMTMDLSAPMAAMGIADPQIQGGVIIGLLLFICWTVFQTGFLQKIAYDSDKIECHGMDLKPQTRTLDDLVDIAMHPRRPALVLTFAAQKRLYVPKALEDRDAFVQEMTRIAKANRARGLQMPAEPLAAKLGL